MSLSPSGLTRLREKAGIMRQSIIKMMGFNKTHHFGGSLSAVEIVTALYFYKMRSNQADPQWAQRDRFIMSKGHAVPAQYAALAMRNVIGVEELDTLKKMDSRLQGHPAMHLTPGIEACGGALGEGLSYANGIALANQILGYPINVYCLLGDGELQEGQVWEAAMTASKHELSNVTAIVDQNSLKAMDETRSSKKMDPLLERWLSFGWCAVEVDGHDLEALCNALDWADIQSQPTVIIANTIKGKGVSFMEGQPQFHNNAISEEQYYAALDELI
jgi:transketolase